MKRMVGPDHFPYSTRFKNQIPVKCLNLSIIIHGFIWIFQKRKTFPLKVQLLGILRCPTCTNWWSNFQSFLGFLKRLLSWLGYGSPSSFMGPSQPQHRISKKNYSPCQLQLKFCDWIELHNFIPVPKDSGTSEICPSRTRCKPLSHWNPGNSDGFFSCFFILIFQQVHQKNPQKSNPFIVGNLNKKHSIHPWVAHHFDAPHGIQHCVGPCLCQGFS